MNYLQAAKRTGFRPIELRRVFEPVLDAFYEVGIRRELTPGLLDLWQYGSPTINWSNTLRLLNAREMLMARLRVNGETADSVLMGFTVVDPWVLLRAACAYTMDDPLPKEFDTLVARPIRAVFDRNDASQTKLSAERAKAADVMKDIKPHLRKAVKALENISPSAISGTVYHDAKVELQRLIELC
ncbi:hypothetical protein [Hydrogenimonas sp.]